MIEIAKTQTSDGAVRYVSWDAVVAGAVGAAALSFVLLTAGASIGLSMVSTTTEHSYPKAAAAFAVFWAVSVTIGSLLVGGYIAGRMRTAWGESSAEEINFRDGVHGFLVWSVSVILGGILGFIATTTAAHITNQSGARSSLIRNVSVVDPAVDALLRPSSSSSATAAAAGSAASEDLRNEMARIYTASLGLTRLSDGDRTYLAQIVSQRTGLPQTEAEKRVDETFADAVAAAKAAKAAAVLAGLVTVSALLLSLAAAWYAAQRGGDHRDRNIPARFGIASRRLP